MTSTTPSSLRPRGNALVPVLIIVAALIISALYFFLVTKKKIDAQHEADAAAQAQKAAIASAADKPAPTPAKAATPAGANPGTPAAATPKAGMTPAPTAPETHAAFGFARPSDVGEQLARSLSSGDLAAAAKLLSAGDAAQEAPVTAMLDQVFKGLGYKAGPPAQVSVIGQTGTTTRIAVPLIDPKTGKVGDTALTLDLERDPKMGWKVSQIRVPKELEPAVAAAMAAARAVPPAPAVPAVATPGKLPVPPPPGAAVPQAMPKPLIVVDKEPDALGFASVFVNHLLHLEYNKALKLVDPERVPPVKLAGLCIVFEDGKYKLQEGKPLVTTLNTDKTSWIITKLHSEALKEDTEFGLEMEREGEKGWRVVGLNMSKLLADNTKSSSLVGIPYTPLVQNPKGGESIALYYEYNQAELHPRAKKQLEIVASILKASPTRKLKIGGHTDALGTDAYNINLSKRRADAVKEFMIVTGVPVDQVETIGFGKAAPLSPNVNPDGSDNPEGRSRNRRAEILLDF